MGMKLRPMGDNVLVERDPPDAVSAGGIIIPDVAKVTCGERGTVIAIGKGRFDEATGERIPIEGIEPGDVVYFATTSGNDFGIADLELTFLRAAEIIAVEGS